MTDEKSLPCGLPVWVGPVRFEQMHIAILCGLTLALSVGCRCSAVDAEPPAATDSGAARPRCGQGKSTARHTLSPQGVATEQQGELPFAVELGSAIVAGGFFLVPHSTYVGDQLQARVQALDGRLNVRGTISLGALSARSSPPRAAYYKGQPIVVALQEADARGEGFRVGSIEGLIPRTGGLDGKPKLTWRSELEGGQDASSAFDLAAGAASVLLVWDDWDPALGTGFIQTASFDLPAWGSELRRISPVDVDAESPRVVPRRDGFWLAWIALGEPMQPSQLAAPQDAVPNDPLPLTVRRRWLQLLSLDSQGRPEGSVLDATARDGFVTAFDLAAGHGGSVMLLWQESNATPGAGGGQLKHARVAPDGSVTRHTVESEPLGPGTPALLLDHDPNGGAPHAWLSAMGSGGASLFAGYSPFSGALEPLASSKLVSEASLLAVHQGQFLVATPRGRGSDLSLVRCAVLDPAD